MNEKTNEKKKSHAKTKLFLAKLSAVMMVVLTIMLLSQLVLKIGTGHRVSPLSNGYFYNKEGVYYLLDDNGQYHWKKKQYLKDVDRATLEVIDSLYARDAKNVYYQGIRIEGADAATFSFLSGIYPMDKNHLYGMDYDLKIHKYIMTATTVDVATAEVIGWPWMHDKDSIYFSDFLFYEHGSFEKDYIRDSRVSGIDKASSPIEKFGESEYLRNGRNLIYYKKIILEDFDFEKIEVDGESFCCVNDTIFFDGSRRCKNAEDYQRRLEEDEERQKLRTEYPTNSGSEFRLMVYVSVICPALILLLCLIGFLKTRWNIKRGRFDSEREKEWLRFIRLLIYLPILPLPLFVMFSLFMFMDSSPNIQLPMLTIYSAIAYPLFHLSVGWVGKYFYDEKGRFGLAYLALAVGTVIVAAYETALLWLLFW